MSSESEAARDWNAESIAGKVRAIVAAKTVGPVLPDSTFDSLGLDSLAMAEVIFEIETAFRIHADERLLDLRSIAEVSDYVAQQVKKEQATRQTGRSQATEFGSR
jgi:acyl carrier protein